MKPKWLSGAQWQKLIEENCLEGVRTQWKEACHMAMQEIGEEEDEVTDQGVVDFTWTVTCAQLTWVLRMACSSALFCIASGYDDVDEIKKIQQLASFKNTKGAQVSLMERRRNKTK